MLAYSLTCLLLTYLLTSVLAYSLTHLLPCLLACLLTHSLACLLTDFNACLMLACSLAPARARGARGRAPAPRHAAGDGRLPHPARSHHAGQRARLRTDHTGHAPAAACVVAFVINAAGCRRLSLPQLRLTVVSDPETRESGRDVCVRADGGVRGPGRPGRAGGGGGKREQTTVRRRGHAGRSSSLCPISQAPCVLIIINHSSQPRKNNLRRKPF